MCTLKEFKEWTLSIKNIHAFLLFSSWSNSPVQSPSNYDGAQCQNNCFLAQFTVAYSFSGYLCTYENNKTSAFLHLLDHFLLLCFTCLTWNTSKFIDLPYCSKCSEVKVLWMSHPKRSDTLLMACNKTGLDFDSFFWFCSCSKFQT